MLSHNEFHLCSRWEGVGREVLCLEKPSTFNKRNVRVFVGEYVGPEHYAIAALQASRKTLNKRCFARAPWPACSRRRICIFEQQSYLWLGCIAPEQSVGKAWDASVVGNGACCEEVVDEHIGMFSSCSGAGSRKVDHVRECACGQDRRSETQ